MQNSPQRYGPSGPSGEPGPPRAPGTMRVSGALVFVLVVVAAHAIGTAFGGWAVLDENFSKQEHGQDLVMPMGAAWFVALFCWGLAALEVTCVVLARRRRPWIRVALAVCLSFVVCATVVAFLGSLPTEDACDTADITGWLRDRQPTRDVLDRSADAATRTEPAALAGCGDALTDEENWKQARARYQRLLDGYPDEPLTGKARSGVKKAGLAIELDAVRALIGTTHDAESGYCDKPAEYSAAPAYGKGTNRALFLGDTEYTGKLPGDRRTDDPAEAALVVCADTAENGAAVESCYYENDRSAYLPHQVTFHKVKIPLKVYELRTGKRIDPRSVQISGGSCPAVLHYEYYGTYDLGPGDQLVSTAKSDVRDAFRPVVTR